LSPEGLVVVREGTTELLVPESYNTSGPGTRTGEVFYNKQMEFGRDISVAFGRAMFKEGTKILDGLAASGARGLRLANECGVRADFVLNDRNLMAAVLMKQNAELNSLGHVRIECRDLRSLLSDEQFDYIDIDPFGTPIDFIDLSLQSVRNNGIVALTATDTAPLYGTYPKTCLRRYGAISRRSPFAHETGVRILVGCIARLAASHDRAVQPLLCYHADHYFRCYARIQNGASRADAAIKQMGYARYDPKSLEREMMEENADNKAAGPLWSGPLFSRDVVKSMKATGDLGTVSRFDKILQTWKEEHRAPPLFYIMDELARRTKASPPKLVDFVGHIRAKGFDCSRTHFDAKAFKTDMPTKKLIETYKKYSRRK
jgi:tRNA (guanine26-N2/guanine27-N2)-dimethyltransferase